ncbi:MAG: hypothetical protein LUG86_07340 [Oscillospiraceae bacterium]|nr:hypothetical protein [Oscillospiraceae bacterium]
MKNKLQGLFAILVLAVMILSLVYIDEVKDSIYKAIESCLTGIIPSLFLNSVLSSVLIKSSKSLKPKRITAADYAIILAYILGNICGYPIGAKMLSELVKDNTITSKQAETAICFSYASGPAYILGIVSAAVFHAKLLGFTAFLSILLSNTVLFIVFVVRRKRSADASQVCKGVPLTTAVMDSIGSSAYSMISICSSIVFFSAMLALIKVLMPSISPAFSAIFEISNITSLQGSGLAFFVLATVLLSFGGLCVHMQVACLAGFSLRKFYLTRPIQVLLTAIFSALGYLIVQNHISIETGTPANIEFSKSGSIVPFICISGMVLIALTYRKQKSDR